MVDITQDEWHMVMGLVQVWRGSLCGICEAAEVDWQDQAMKYANWIRGATNVVTLLLSIEDDRSCALWEIVGQCDKIVSERAYSLC